jgi:iron-regulated transporter 1
MSDGGDAPSASDGIGSSDLPLLGAGEVPASNNHSAALARSLPFLYLSHALSAFGDRMWQFAIPILFMEIWDDSLLPAALFALVTNCATFLLMAHVGKWVDRSPRMALMRISLLGQNAAIATSCLLLYSLVYLAKPEAVNADVGVAWTLEVKLCFGMIVACSAVGELMGNAGTLALERDWVVVLAAGDQPALAAMNSTMRRIDLLCKLLAPLGFGLLMQVLGTCS